jgi:hypothetical protein
MENGEYVNWGDTVIMRGRRDGTQGRGDETEGRGDGGNGGHARAGMNTHRCTATTHDRSCALRPVFLLCSSVVQPGWTS